MTTRSLRFLPLLSLVLTAALAGCAQPASAPAAPTTQAATGAATGVATAPRTEVRREALAQGLYELAHSARQNAVFVNHADPRIEREAGEGSHDDRSRKAHRDVE